MLYNIKIMTLSEFIHQSLHSRIASGAFSPGLTLAELSREFKVSPMPVRQAIQRLVDEGLLQKERGRLHVTGRTGGRLGGKAKPPEPVPPRDPFQRVLHDLLPLSFQGGCYLREEAVARRYGVSRTIIRRIFTRLAGIGVLEHRDRCGSYLRPFNLRELRDFLQAREAMELKALELAKGHLDPQRLREILNGNVLPRGERPFRTDNSFHRYLIEQADNRYISLFFENYGMYYELLFEWEGKDRESETLACRQHRGILLAMLAEDWPRAARLLSDHILHNHRVLTEAEFCRLVTDVPGGSRTGNKE